MARGVFAYIRDAAVSAVVGSPLVRALSLLQEALQVLCVTWSDVFWPSSRATSLGCVSFVRVGMRRALIALRDFSTVP